VCTDADSVRRKANHSIQFLQPLAT